MVPAGEQSSPPGEGGRTEGGKIETCQLSASTQDSAIVGHNVYSHQLAITYQADPHTLHSDLKKNICQSLESESDEDKNKNCDSDINKNHSQGPSSLSSKSVFETSDTKITVECLTSEINEAAKESPVPGPSAEEVKIVLEDTVKSECSNSSPDFASSDCRTTVEIEDTNTENTVEAKTLYTEQETVDFCSESKSLRSQTLIEESTDHKDSEFKNAVEGTESQIECLTSKTENSVKDQVAEKVEEGFDSSDKLDARHNFKKSPEKTISEELENQSYEAQVDQDLISVKDQSHCHPKKAEKISDLEFLDCKRKDKVEEKESFSELNCSSSNTNNFESFVDNDNCDASLIGQDPRKIQGISDNSESKSAKSDSKVGTLESDVQTIELEALTSLKETSEVEKLESDRIDKEDNISTISIHSESDVAESDQSVEILDVVPAQEIQEVQDSETKREFFKFLKCDLNKEDSSERNLEASNIGGGIQNSSSNKNDLEVDVTKIQSSNPGLEQDGGRFQCAICGEVFPSQSNYFVHLHQYHANPEHLSLAQVKQFSISDHLLNRNLGDRKETLLYRCHDCLTVMGTAAALRDHIHSHRNVVNNLTKLMPQRRRTVMKRTKNKVKKGLQQQPPPAGRDEAHRRLSDRPRRLAAVQRRLVSHESEQSDEFNSNSENESDLSNRRKVSRPQRECKTRTKTLVAISLAEQDYDKFDLDFGKFKTDVTRKVSESEESTVSETKPSTPSDGSTSPDFSSEQVSSDLKSAASSPAASQPTAILKPTPKSKDVRKAREQKSSRRRNTALKNYTEFQPVNGKAKFPGFLMKDRKKVGKIVSEMVEGTGDYVCLSCNGGFRRYSDLVAHKRKCSENSLLIAGDRLTVPQVKIEPVPPTNELSQYVTESVVKVPETTFNNMHGKLNHIKTEDADKFTNSCPNALGLVRMNFSGDWTVKDVWETAGWEPKEDQLTWQSYEVLAAVNSDLEQADASAARLSVSPRSRTATSPNTRLSAAHAKSERDVAADQDSAATITSPAKAQHNDTSPRLIKSEDGSPVSATSITRKLTSQIMDRQRPVISNIEMQRSFLLKLSSIPWAEQKRVKESLDSALAPKRLKKSEKVADAQFKGSVVPSRLDLRQVARSVKYTKQRGRPAVTKDEKADNKRAADPEVNQLAGEWEIDHTFLCSVCGVEYDDMVEIMHHKWEAHPHCLVTHVCLKHNVQRPPALMFPQVGPSKVSKEPPKVTEFTCSKCQQQFTEAKEFHSHILLCGGLAISEISPTKRKRKKGHGGGLKSTVRMLKKSSQTEESPRKRRPAPRDFSNVPLVPTHNRTTRFKENKEKEAKLLKAKERRKKYGKNRRGLKKAAEKAKVDKDVKRVVKKILDKVEVQDTTPQRRRSLKAQQNTGSDRGISRTRVSASSSQNVSTATPSSSESQPKRGSRRSTRLAESSVRLLESTNEASEPTTPLEIIAAVNLIIDQVVSEIESRPQPSSTLSAASIANKSVLVSAFDDDSVPRIVNHDILNVPRTPLKRSRSNSKEPVGGVDRDATTSAERELISAATSPQPHHQTSSRSGTTTPAKSDGSAATKPESPAASRIQKRLQSDLTDRLMPGENLAKRRAVSRPTSPTHSRSRRSVFPLDFKISVLDRVEAGETISAVASDLDIPVSAVAKWWMIRSELRDRLSQGSTDSSNDGFPDLMTYGGNELVAKKLTFVLGEELLKSEDTLHKGELPSSSDNPAENEVSDLKSGDAGHVNRNRSSRNNGALKDKRSSRPSGSPARKRRKTKDLTLSDLLNEDGSLIKSKSRLVGRKKISLPPGSKLCSEKENVERDEEGVQPPGKAVSDEKIKVDVVEDQRGEQDLHQIIRPRRHSTIGYQLPAPSPFRQVMPLEVKQEAIQRISQGESQSTVARDLDVSVSTISSWWRKKDSLLLPADHGASSGAPVGGDDIEDQTIDELVQMEVEEKNVVVNDNKSAVVDKTNGDPVACRGGRNAVIKFGSTFHEASPDPEIVAEFCGSVPSVILELSGPSTSVSSLKLSEEKFTSSEGIKHNTTAKTVTQTKRKSIECLDETSSTSNLKNITSDERIAQSSSKDDDTADCIIIEAESLKVNVEETAKNSDALKNNNSTIESNEKEEDSSAKKESDSFRKSDPKRRNSTSSLESIPPPAKTDLLKSMKLAFNFPVHSVVNGVDPARSHDPPKVNCDWKQASREVSTGSTDSSSETSTNKPNELDGGQVCSIDSGAPPSAETNSRSPKPMSNAVSKNCNNEIDTQKVVDKRLVIIMDVKSAGEETKPQEASLAAKQDCDKPPPSGVMTTSQHNSQAKDSLQPASWPRKRKSLEFLANTLMQKALGHTAISPLNCGEPEKPVKAVSCAPVSTTSALQPGALGLVRDGRVGPGEES